MTAEEILITAAIYVASGILIAFLFIATMVALVLYKLHREPQPDFTEEIEEMNEY